jgi:hypothetical protein
MKLPMFLRRDKWILVKTFTEGLQSTNTRTGRATTGKIYFHLYESLKGNRRVEMTDTLNLGTKESVVQYGESTDTYNDIIVRWLSGRRDPNIPTYAQIPEQDTADALRGQISK